MRVVSALVLFASLTSSGCGSSASSGTPTAPSGLTAALLSGGAHLTWKDNSSNEEHFMIERMIQGGTYQTLVTLPFDTTTYHDAPLTAGKMYMYHVMAMGADGTTSMSNEAMIQIP